MSMLWWLDYMKQDLDVWSSGNLRIEVPSGAVHTGYIAPHQIKVLLLPVGTNVQCRANWNRAPVDMWGGLAAAARVRSAPLFYALANSRILIHKHIIFITTTALYDRKCASSRLPTTEL